jgi:hypothetical protein
MKVIKEITVDGKNDFVVLQTMKIVQAILDLPEQDRLFLGNKLTLKPKLLVEKMPLIKNFI